MQKYFYLFEFLIVDERQEGLNDELYDSILLGE